MKMGVGRGLTRLRQLVAGLFSRRSRFKPRPVYMGFLVDKVTLGLVVLLVLTV
jgi:hypothetical protein